MTGSGQSRNSLQDDCLRNGQPSLGHSISGLARVGMKLAALQISLARVEVSNGFARWALTLLVLVAAAVTGLGTVPVALLLLASAVNDIGNLGPTASPGIAAVCGLVMAVVPATVAWRIVRNRLYFFQQSSCELKRNIVWPKQLFDARGNRH